MAKFQFVSITQLLKYTIILYRNDIQNLFAPSFWWQGKIEICKTLTHFSLNMLGSFQKRVLFFRPLDNLTDLKLFRII